MTYYTIYKTTNKINGRFYIGQHKTDNPYDSYLGSGTVLKSAIEFYGAENFYKEILFFCENEEDMDKKEVEIVTPHFLKEHEGICYNVCVGGYNGCRQLIPSILPKDDQKFVDWYESQQASLPQHKPKDSIEYKEWYDKNCKYSPSMLPKDDQKFIDWKQSTFKNNKAMRSKDDPEYVAWLTEQQKNLPQHKPKDSIEYKEWFNKNKESAQKAGLKKLNRVWIRNPITNKTKTCSKEYLQQHLNDGWIMGRK